MIERDRRHAIVRSQRGSGRLRQLVRLREQLGRLAAGTKPAASDAASYQSSVVSQATSALSNATGVNLDTEMTNMLNIENSYTTSAKLLTTVNDMFSALMNAA